MKMITGFQKRVALLLSAMLLLLAIPVLPTMAQELSPEQLTLARKYIDLTDNAKIFEITLLKTAKSTMKTIVSQNPELDDPAARAIVKTLDFYREHKSDLLDQFARVYAQTFTIDELKQIVAFYESPIGVKLAKANQSLNESLQMVLKVYEDNLGKEFFAKVRADLKAAGFNI